MFSPLSDATQPLAGAAVASAGRVIRGNSV